MSDFLANEFFKNYFIVPKHIIPNGINGGLFSKEIFQKDIDILGVGSLIPLKRYDIFVSIVKQITDKIPAVQAVLCGKGTEENNLKSLIKKINLQKSISLTDELPHKDVLEIMQRSKIFLHLEALAAGGHVISFCRPMNDSINHWHIVSNEEEMLDKALEILRNPQANYESVFPYLMNDTAKKMMVLFEYR
jgi:hypothetical protein